MCPMSIESDTEPSPTVLLNVSTPRSGWCVTQEVDGLKVTQEWGIIKRQVICEAIVMCRDAILLPNHVRKLNT